MNMNENLYLTDMPQEIDKYGLCKTLAVRSEIIHIKHIMTEVFVRKTINVSMLSELGYDVMKYMEFLTNRIRRVHYFRRDYKANVNNIVKNSRDRFFPTIDLLRGMNNVIVLDFDGVITSKKFKPLYDLCVDRSKTVICSANPTITESWFSRRSYRIPSEIFSNKGKTSKIKRLIEIAKRHDNVFYVDNEKEYLNIAWLFGIRTFIFEDGEIKHYTLNTK